MNFTAATYNNINPVVFCGGAAVVDGEGFCCEPKAQAKNARSLPTENVDYEKLQYYYHSDHLGSASYITNLDGEVVQHVEYVPFGEVFLEERNNTWNTPFLFNGKELDEETGLYYYGARYYNPRISLWYGVDPLAEKRPHMSPYNYCSWNPIMKIDPDGMDEWELNKKGEEVNRIKNEKHDSFHIVETDEDGKIVEDEDGNSKRIASSKPQKAGTVEKVTKPSVTVKGKPETLTQFHIKGDDAAKEIFEFLGDNYTESKGRPIEWTHAKIGKDAQEKNIIGTHHNGESTAVGTFLRENNYTLREVNHNHPSGVNLPSKGDVANAEEYYKANSNIKLGIYYPGLGYRSYNRNSTPYAEVRRGGKVISVMPIH